jgi:branched-chain amino acid transport system permease protein
LTATLLAGLALGAVYTIVAIGFNLSWLPTRTINFAQGSYVVAGMFLTIWCDSLGLPALVILPILALCGAVLAALTYTIAIRPVQRRGEHAELVTTVGVMTIVQGVILLFASEDPHRVPGFVPERLIDVPGGRVSVDEIVLIVLALVLGVGTHLWIHRTRLGIAALGISEDREAAMLLGVNTMRFSYGAFMVAGVLGLGVAQVVGPKTFAVVSLATMLSIKGFIALAIGGLGSSIGALLGGLLIGSVEAVVARELGATWQNTAIFLIFVVVMLLLPRGLFGSVKERTV